MRQQRSIVGAAVLCVGLSAACGGGAPESETMQTEQQGTTPGNAAGREEMSGQAGGRPEPANVDGCLTEANGQFVLTTLQPEGGSTQTYQLINADQQQLRPHVGREVRVAGEAEPARVAEVRETTPAGSGTTGTGAAGTSGQQPQAQVSTESRTRLEMRRLSVINVTPTGDPCPTSGAAR